LSFSHSIPSQTVQSHVQTVFTLPRYQVFVWVVTIFAANWVLDAVEAASTAVPDDLATELAAVGIFQCMAWYAVFHLLLASDRRLQARWQDVMVCALLSLCLLLPTSRSLWIAATGGALYLGIFSAGDRKLRAAGIVLAALSVQQFWGHMLFELFSFPLLRAETAAVGSILDVTGAGATWQQNVIAVPSGHAIVILSACSSFHNISIALLCWVTISRLRALHWCLRDVAFGALIAGSVVVLNGSRLYLMALSNDLYTYWHQGAGSQIFAIGVSLLVLLLSLLGSRRAEGWAR
jgi:hypothetical protein